VDDKLLGIKLSKFIIGHNRAVFYIHHGLMLYLLASLNALVNGGTKESLEGCITWEDVDINVFFRFAQFVYTSAYVSFAPTKRESPAGHTKGAGGTTMDVDGKGPEITAPPEPLGGNRKGRFEMPYSLASFNATACNRAFGSSDRPSVKRRDFILAFIGIHEEKRAGIAGEGFGRSLFGQNSSSALQNIWQTKPTPQIKSYEQVFIGHAKIWVIA
jgi:hypothetical protein